MRMQKAIFKIKMSEFTAYRSNVCLNFMFGCVPLVLYILLWKAIYGEQVEIIGGYSYKQMITYYVIAFLLSNILNVRDNTVKIATMIEDGSIHNQMLKPIGFFSLNFKLYRAEKLIYLLNISIPYLIFCLVFRRYIFWKASHLPFFFLSVCVAFVLKYIIGSILGFLTAWIEEISGLLDFWENIEGFLSGGLLPLSILPKPLFTVISFLPFKYILFVPIDIYMGNIQGIEIAKALGIQVLWSVALGILLYKLKKEAFRKYTGYGS